MKSSQVKLGLDPMTGSLIRRDKFGHRYIREERHAKLEAEVRVMQLQAKQPRTAANTRSHKKQRDILPLQPSERA